MPLTQPIADFRSSAAQCDALIANAHRLDAGGNSILPPLDREQITVAAFLNLFIAWEIFLEVSLAEFMIGSTTLSGSNPVRYVSPPSLAAARELVIGAQRFFDYGNHDFVRRIVSLYFQNGYPYEPHLNAISADLSDLRTLRNASAHITSTTQTALESLALRVFAAPSPNITLYTLLTRNDPRSAAGETVFAAFRNKLIVTAELIAQG